MPCLGMPFGRGYSDRASLFNNDQMSKNKNKKHRFHIYEQCNYSCKSCGLSFNIPENWDKLSAIRNEFGVCLEIDHIIPISLGGRDSIENKQALCQRCNTKKSNRIIKY